MSKQTSLLLTDEAVEVITEYIEKNNCSRNKAVNDLIMLARNQIGKEPIEVRLGKANLKIGQEIDKKLDELKVILTNGKWGKKWN